MVEDSASILQVFFTGTEVVPKGPRRWVEVWVKAQPLSIVMLLNNLNESVNSVDIIQFKLCFFTCL